MRIGNPGHFQRAPLPAISILDRVGASWVQASVTRAAKYPPGGFQGGGNHLVHVVVAVLGEAANEEDVRFAGGKGFVALVESFVFRARDGVVRIALSLGILTDNGGAGVALAGEMLKFRDAGVGVVIGIVDDGDWLVLGEGGQVLVFETQGAVGKRAKAVAEIGIDGTGVDDGFGIDPVANGEEIGAEFEADIGVVEHPLEHGSVTVLRHDLELVAEVAVIAAGADRDAGGDGGAELRGIKAPLLAGITAKEFFVEVAADGIENGIFAGFDGVARFARPVEEGLNAGFVEIQSVETINGVLINGDRQKLAIHTGKDTVFVGHPAGEAGEVVYDALGIGVEDMGAIAVNKDTVGVRFIVGVAADMGTLVDDQNQMAGAREAFGDRTAGKASADDGEIDCFHA